MAATRTTTKRTTAGGYDAVKEFQGRRYTGMQVGRSHYWDYDAGEWKETKRTPDLWTIHYAVTKRRRGHAPKGSGVPVGTAYDWTIIGQQIVRKLNANDYSTELIGLKFKLAHKRADTANWSVSEAGRVKRLATFLRGVLADLEKHGLSVLRPAPPPPTATKKPASPRSRKAAPRTPRATAGRSAQRSATPRKRRTARATA